MNITEHEFMQDRWYFKFLMFINPNFSVQSWIIAKEVEETHLGFQKNLKILMILIRERWKENLMKKWGVSAEKRREWRV